MVAALLVRRKKKSVLSSTFSFVGPDGSQALTVTVPVAGGQTTFMVGSMFLYRGGRISVFAVSGGVFWMVEMERVSQ
jgi:hypothetical protein